MDLLMNPQVAYLIFMGSLGLLYYELTHPGVIAPGVVGGVGLIISLVSLHMLDATWGAARLILLGIAFLVAEAFVPGFGILGAGGIVAFFVGSLFLFDFETTGYQLPLSLVASTTLPLGAMMLGVAYLAYSTRKLRRHGAADDFTGRAAKVDTVQEGDSTFGYVEIDGELWKCTAEKPLKKGETVYILKNQGLTLTVSHEPPPKEQA
jgi:membrane-bound serine protease (ClpP class)